MSPCCRIPVNGKCKEVHLLGTLFTKVQIPSIQHQGLCCPCDSAISLDDGIRNHCSKTASGGNKSIIIYKHCSIRYISDAIAGPVFDFVDKQTHSCRIRFNLAFIVDTGQEVRAKRTLQAAILKLTVLHSG